MGKIRNFFIRLKAKNDFKKVMYDEWSYGAIDLFKFYCAYCDTEEEIEEIVNRLKRYEWRKEHGKLERLDNLYMWDLLFDMKDKGYARPIEFEDGLPVGAGEAYRNFISKLDGDYLVNINLKNNT